MLQVVDLRVLELRLNCLRVELHLQLRQAEPQQHQEHVELAGGWELLAAHREQFVKEPDSKNSDFQSRNFAQRGHDETPQRLPEGLESS